MANQKIKDKVENNSETKTLELAEKQVDIKIKKLQLKEKRENINLEKRKINNTDNQTLIDKVNILRYLLMSTVVDEETTVIGSEQRYKSIFTETEQWRIKDKMFKIIDTL